MFYPASTIELGWNAGSGHETHGHPLQRISALEGGDAGVAVVHGNPPGLTEIGNLHVTQLDLVAFGSGFATRQKGDIMQHTFALIAEARCPNGGNLQIATQFFYNQSGKRFSGDVLCDYQHRPPTFCNLLQQREQIISGADCSFVDEDIDVVERNFHALGSVIK